MVNKINRRELLKKAALAVPGVLALNSCGTLLYPERKGRSGGRVDPAVIVMDGLLCLVFLLPGVVAFAVDFSTGAIYTGGHASLQKHDVQGTSEDDYNAVLAKATGRDIKLSDSALRVSQKEGVLTASDLHVAKNGVGKIPRLVKDSDGHIIRCEAV